MRCEHLISLMPPGTRALIGAGKGRKGPAAAGGSAKPAAPAPLRCPAGGKYDYNGVHLRIEKDARDWAMIMGGQQVGRQAAPWALLPGAPLWASAPAAPAGPPALIAAWRQGASFFQAPAVRGELGCRRSFLQPACCSLVQVVWHGYIKTMTAVGMDNSTRLYVASGMLTYGEHAPAGPAPSAAGLPPFCL